MGSTLGFVYLTNDYDGNCGFLEGHGFFQQEFSTAEMFSKPDDVFLEELLFLKISAWLPSPLTILIYYWGTDPL